MEENKCKYCGCTELDCSICFEKSGSPCHWIDEEETICSVCAKEHKINEELVRKLEYARQCADHALRQEKKDMELLGKWYIKQQIQDLERTVNRIKDILSIK